MVRIILVGVTAIQIATIYSNVQNLTDWRVDWNPHRQKPFITIKEHSGVVEMILGRLPQELCLAVCEIVQNAGIHEDRIRIENE